MEIMEDNYSMSGHFMSFFAKEFIKHEILVQIYIFGNKEFPLYEKHEAHKKLALTTGLNDYNVELLVACTGLCSTLNLRLSHIVRQCLNIGWPLERALFLAPHWLRTIESKLHLLQYVIQNETSESVSMTQTLKVFHFNAQLVAIARSAVKAGKSFYSKDIFDSFSVAYDTKMVKILSLWKRMCTNVKKNITAKAETGDHPCNSYKVDWLIADFLLLYDKSFRVVTSNSLLRVEELKCLVILFKLVVKHNIETLIQNRNPALVQAWMNLYMNYPSSGEISLVLLQRRWYDLKMEARFQVLQYWRGETVTQPHPLLLAIVSNFRYIVLEPYPKWSHLVNYGLIVEFKDITKEVCDRAINDFDGDDDDRTLCVCKYNPKPPLKSYAKLPIISENTALHVNTSPADVNNVRNNSINTNIGTNSNLNDSLEYRNRLMKDDRNIRETEAQENAGKVNRSMSPCLVIHIDLDSDSSHENSTSRNLRQKPDIYKDGPTSSEMFNKEVISERHEVKNNLLHAKATDSFDVKVGVTAEKSTSTEIEENFEELLNENE
ncbi:uncharacterized protein [Battus philenor]|uniref:uncharacterized protein n=1 Tax=Battus philenor TaxID=42288 RepID=UPI0035CFB43C